MTSLILSGGAYWTWPVPGGGTVEADLYNGHGERIGRAVFTQLPEGGRVKVAIERLPPGIHAMHIHTVGECHGPEFKSAGAHFNPFERKHGMKNTDGPHAGDLPNFEVREDGTAQVEVTALLLTLEPGINSLLPTGKTCLVIHEKADDETTDPAGNAGARLACGIIRKP